MTILVSLVLIFSTLRQDALTDGESIADVVRDSFESTHDGYSSDEVILNDALNSKFIDACKNSLPNASTAEFNWTLINLRKAGKLSQIKTTARNRLSTEDVKVLAEVVARTMLDRERVSIDRIMANPVTRKKFNEIVRGYDANVDLYLVRKATFQLRKARRLRPELITRIADWDRKISTIKVSDFRANQSLAPQKPGVYIFHDDSGYLYIGHSDDIRHRLKNHLDDSSNIALAKYLGDASSKEVHIEIHSFPADSRAKEIMIRRAYESELIRSRKPRFNILP